MTGVTAVVARRALGAVLILAAAFWAVRIADYREKTGLKGDSTIFRQNLPAWAYTWGRPGWAIPVAVAVFVLGFALSIVVYPLALPSCRCIHRARGR